MNKEEVQKRVSKNGKPLPLSKFSWDPDAKVFSTEEEDCCIDFSRIDDVTIISGDGSTQKSGVLSIQKAGSHSTQKAGDGSVQKSGYESTQKAGDCSHQKSGAFSTQEAGSRSTQKSGDGSTQKAGDLSIQEAGSHSTQKAGDCSTQKAGGYSVQKAGGYSVQEAGTLSTQISTSLSTHTATSGKVAVVRSSTMETLVINESDDVQSCPDGIEGFVINGMYKGEPHIIADGIVSKIINQKGSVYKVKNLGEDKESWLIKDGDTYAHGETLKEAREDLLYKAKDKDTSAYKEYTLDTVVAHTDALKMYRTITGACSGGMKHFVEQNSDEVKDEYTIAELIELTAGAYKSDRFKQFFRGE